MFTIKIDEVEYKFSFKHHPIVVPPYTICYVDIKDGGISYYAWLHPNDRYSRETGRKVALTRALKDLFPNNKAARKEVWKTYFYTLAYTRVMTQLCK
jgi:hypothetical protein